MIQTLNDMRQKVNATRILLKPSFQDFDKSRCSHITKDQFSRVLKKLTLMPQSEQLFELIVRKYFDKGNTKEVNYVQFCQDVDRPEDMFPGYTPKRPQLEPVAKDPQQKPTSTFYGGSTANVNVLENRFSQKPIFLDNDPSDVERRLQSAIVMKRVRIEEFFRDFDKLRKGKVTIPQFKSVLSMLNFNLTEDEFESLADRFRTADGMFDHASFCEFINSAFTQKGIDKNPNAKVNPVTSEATMAARRKYLEQTEEEQQGVLDIIQEYRRAVQNKRINLKPMF